MALSSKPLEVYKVTYRHWLWQIVGDIKRLSRAAGLRPMVEHLQGIQCVADYNQHPREVLLPLGYPRIRTGPNADKLPLYLRELVDDELNLGVVNPLELVCAYRHPFPRRRLDEFPSVFHDPWLWWTSEAATGLFAHPAWVRYTLYLLQPMNLPYRHEQWAHADLASEVWSRLLDTDLGWCKGAWLRALKQAQWSGRYRRDFWDIEAPPYLLTGVKV